MLPIDLNEDSTYNITKQSKAGRLLASADLIIWDEVPMQHKYCCEAVHRLVIDLRGTDDDVLFGGVSVILSGDFAQILPVVSRGSEGQIVSACLRKSFTWPRLKQLALRKNMRVRQSEGSSDFVRWVLSVPYDPALRTMVILPAYVKQPSTVSELIDHVYPADLLRDASQDHATFAGRCLLSTSRPSRSSTTRFTILGRIPVPVRHERTHVSGLRDYPKDGTGYGRVSAPLAVRGLAEPRTALDVPWPAPLEGWRSGDALAEHLPAGGHMQRLPHGGDRPAAVQHWGEDFRGLFDGQERLIPRIDFLVEKTPLGIAVIRKQLPVRMCFAMTINKSQGQSFHTVGLDLRTPVFTHEQLYMALSRTSSVTGLAVILPENSGGRTKKVVYPEVLLNIDPPPPLAPVLGDASAGDGGHAPGSGAV